MKEEEQKETVIHLGKHLITSMATELQQRFGAWQQFAIEEVGAVESGFPSMPVEMNVVTMKVADGQVFNEQSLDEIDIDPGVPMKIEISRPWFVEFQNGVLPRDGEDPVYTPKNQIPTLIKAILSEAPQAVGFLYVAESWVWRGELSEYVPYDVDPNAGPREEALVVTFQSVTGDTVTGVMAINKEGVTRTLKELEFGNSFNTDNVVH